MQLADRCGNKWKATIDAEHRVYFYNRRKPALEAKICYPADKLAGFYRLDAREKNDFLKSLGKRMGMPMWPLFVERALDKELELFSSLGVLGRREEDYADEDDHWQFIIPEPKDSALEKKPSIAPSPEEIEEHEKKLQTLRSAIDQEGIAALCLEVLADKEKTVRRMDRATDLIQICAVCSQPAEQVGIYPEGDGTEKIILHGMCPDCSPGNDCDPQKVEAMKKGVARLIEQGRVKAWRD
ncbi:MAG: hypothetical protein ACQES5_01485 [Thermodesulfobacteriota bacterium]